MTVGDTLGDIWGNIRGLTLNELLEAWNDLRNQVMGRGVSKPPGVSQTLYDVTSDEYKLFRKWLTEKSALTLMLAEVTQAPQQLERYRAVYAMAAREGIRAKLPPHMPSPETLVELLQQAPLTEKDLAETRAAPKDQLLPRQLRTTLASPGFDYGDLAKAVVVGVVSTLLVRVIMKVMR